MRNLIKRLLRENLEEALKNESFILYHGSPNKIKKFTDEFVGGKDATDQEGPGLYFTTSYDEALGYADGGYVYEVRVSPRLLFDESEEKDINKDVLEKLVFLSENWEDHASNWDPNPKIGVENMIDSAYKYNDNEKDVLLQIWIEAYRYDGVNFVRNCVKVGIDGIIVNRENGKHVIIYNPKIIELTNIEDVSKEISEGSDSEPLVLDIMKNPEPAPNMGSRYGQDVEPHGTYVLQREPGNNSEGWLIGKAVLDNPLMVNITDDTLVQYKRDLVTQYKAKGKRLTNKLMQKGHDALITVKPNGSYGEIVLFPNSKFMLN
jgi:hypothetical protein